MKRALRGAAVLFAALAATGAAEPRRATLNGVEFDLPPYFEKSEDGTGFVDVLRGSVILVDVQPIALEGLTARYSDEALTAEKIEVLERRDVVMGHDKGQFLKLVMRSKVVDVHKWAVFFGNDLRSAVIVANTPAVQAPAVGPQLEEAVLSARWSFGRRYDPFADVSFYVENLSTLKPAGRKAEMFYFTKDGLAPLRDPADPLFSVGLQPGRAKIDKKEFTRRFLRRVPNVKKVDIEWIRPVERSGLKGFEAVGGGTESRTGKALRFYLLILFDDERSAYFVHFGSVGADRWQTVLEDFKGIRAAYKSRVARQ